MKKRILSILVLIVGIMIVYGIYYTYPKSITRSINGVEYQLGGGKTKSVQINVQGKLQHSLLGNKTFVGKIGFKGVSYPNKDSNRQLKIKFQENGSGNIIYAYYKNGTPVINSYGVLFINNDFSKVSIQVFKPDNDGGKTWFAKNGLIISGPAKSIDKALEIANDLMKNVRAFVQ
ncbi:hypothetical protein J5Y03_02685 [Bacillus sp. RG28]|uniref:Uncharacterized protein n=1 Tax=Gottfriedia endophytica TaxID=2820819 RepID=A0A940NMC3_9BACI|nr:hypothetical protein [Gottfriedia endophytica]MBP0724088.1 hypothetical protein [Gottfriedia endophytica]